MKAEYRVVRQELHRTEIGSYTAYGIEALDGQGHILAHISDISTRSAGLETLTETLNRLEVSALHLEDVILDYIA